MSYWYYHVFVFGLFSWSYHVDNLNFLCNSFLSCVEVTVSYFLGVKSIELYEFFFLLNMIELNLISQYISKWNLNHKIFSYEINNVYPLHWK